MPLDPQAKMVLDFLSSRDTPSLEKLPLDQARLAFEKMSQMSCTPPPPVTHIEDRQIAGPGGQIPLRIYSPFLEGTHPVLVYYHGGGWVIGNIESHDSLCRQLANQSQCIVISVDYRLAPEHKFPAAVEDAYAAVQWVANHAEEIHVDAHRIAVGGDSAGGNLAAVVCLMAKKESSPSIAFQLLIYPATGMSSDTNSHKENGEGYFLTKDLMTWFTSCYIQSVEDLDNPYVAPLKAQDFSGLPPAFVLTGEFDPLRDEGEAYAEKLRNAGVCVESKRYEGMIHGFICMDGFLEKGKQAIADSAHALQNAFFNQSH